MTDMHPPLTIDDQPAEKDALHFTHHCQAFKELITDPRTRTPLVIGIFGRWGTGKTTFMTLLRKELRREKVATVWFNAWQYSQEDELWAAFLQSLINQAGEDLPALEKARFYLRLFLHRTDWRVALRLAAQTLLRILVVIIPLILAWPIVQRWWSGAYQVILKLAGGVVAVAAGWWGAIKPLIEAVRKEVKMDFSAARKSSDYQQHIAFLDKFREHFTDIVNSLPSKNHARLAVFIDDLDRCAPDRALQVLDAVKLFVDVPGCFFILGLDDILIQKAVQEKYKDSLEEQQHYLDKIVQLAFHIPPFIGSDMEGFISVLGVSLPDPRCLNVIAAGLPGNPRQVKRSLNLFLLSMFLAEKQGLGQAALHPVLLAKVIMLQQLFPGLFDLVREEPGLLPMLEEYFCLKDETKLPDHLLILHPIFTDSFHKKNLPFLASAFHLENNIPPEKIVSRAEELASQMDREDRLEELIKWWVAFEETYKEELTKPTDWNDIHRQIDIARQKATIAPSLPDELLPFASNKALNGLLLLFKEDPQVSFARLDERQLTPYFSLTRQMKVHLDHEPAEPEAALPQASSVPARPAA
ncbi:MAG: P-loop NTPase fold protein [Omnitrophica WOR_2 bacterium]